jgi:hypothetical protein
MPLLKGSFGSLQIFSIGRMPGVRNLLSPDAILAIPTRVLHFEVSGLRRPTPFRPVVLFGLGFVDQPRNLVVFW